MHTIRGRVAQIVFQNISKAAGRYAYNVELTVLLDSVEPSVALWEASPLSPPERVQVRIHQSLGWRTLTDDERVELAPSGPRSRMSTQSWRGFVVGEVAQLEVRSTGFALFHLD